MNFAEAVNEMLKGKKVRRPLKSDWGHGATIWIDTKISNLIQYGYGVYAQSSISDYHVAQTDWEVEEEKIFFKDLKEKDEFTIPGDSYVKTKVNVEGTSQYYAVQKSNGKLFSYADEQEVKLFS